MSLSKQTMADQTDKEQYILTRTCMLPTGSMIKLSQIDMAKSADRRG